MEHGQTKSPLLQTKKKREKGVSGASQNRRKSTWERERIITQEFRNQLPILSLLAFPPKRREIKERFEMKKDRTNKPFTGSSTSLNPWQRTNLCDCPKRSNQLGFLRETGGRAELSWENAQYSKCSWVLILGAWEHETFPPKWKSNALEFLPRWEMGSTFMGHEIT